MLINIFKIIVVITTLCMVIYLYGIYRYYVIKYCFAVLILKCYQIMSKYISCINAIE